MTYGTLFPLNAIIMVGSVLGTGLAVSVLTGLGVYGAEHVGNPLGIFGSLIAYGFPYLGVLAFGGLIYLAVMPQSPAAWAPICPSRFPGRSNASIASRRPWSKRNGRQHLCTDHLRDTFRLRGSPPGRESHPKTARVGKSGRLKVSDCQRILNNSARTPRSERTLGCKV